jgi:hypothetical protein
MLAAGDRMLQIIISLDLLPERPPNTMCIANGKNITNIN